MATQVSKTGTGPASKQIVSGGGAVARTGLAPGAGAPPPPAAPAAPSNGLTGDALKKFNALQQIANSGTAAAPTAKRLAAQIQANPNVISDPTFDTQLQQTIVSYGSSVAGGSLPKPIQDILQSSVTQPLVAQEQAKTAAAQRAATSQQIVDLTTKRQADNQAFVDTNVTPRLGAADYAAANASAADANALAGQTQSRNTARDALNGLVAQQGQLANQYNAQGDQLLGDYTGQQAGLNAQDQAGLSQYMSSTDPLMNQLQARGWGADVQNDPEGLAAQRQALGMAQGAANGSLDYTAAQYGSDQNDIWAQKAAMQRFAEIGGGSLSYQSKGADAYADPQDVQNQRNALSAIVNDQDIGGNDQRDAMNKFKALSSPTATAQEAFLAEQARRKFENDDRSSREAVNEDLAQRGIRSGSAEIAGQLADREQMSQDRTLAELGLQANAVGRSMTALGGYATEANALRGSQQQGLGLRSQLSTNLRNAGFDESYKRGVASDVASANNQGTRLSGYQLQGNQANQIRNANDAVGTFNTGQTNNARANNQSTRSQGITQTGNAANSIRSANDAIATFNKTGSQIAQRYQDSYAQDEATRVGNLAGQRAQTGLATTSQVGARNTGVYNAGVNNNDTNYTRSMTPTTTGIQAAKDIYGMDTDVNQMGADVGQRAVNRTTTGINNSIAVAGARNGTASTDLNAIIAALQKQQADAEAARAEALL